MKIVKVTLDKIQEYIEATQRDFFICDCENDTRMVNIVVKGDDNIILQATEHKLNDKVRAMFAKANYPSSPTVTLLGYDSLVTYHSDVHIPQRGSSFSIDAHSKVSSEGQIVDQDLVFSLSSTGNVEGFLQMFRASVDNIHDILISVEAGAEGATETVIFDCEYVDNNDASADWSSSDSNKLEVRSDTNPVKVGNYCLKLRTKDDGAIGEQVSHHYGSDQDWSSNIGLDFWFQQESSGVDNEWRLRIEDADNNVMYYDFYCSENDTWEGFNVHFDEFVNFATVDMSTIRYIRFECRDCDNNERDHYIDDIKLYGSITENVALESEIYHFGDTSTPTSLLDGTIILQDNDTTSLISTIYTQKKPNTLHIHVGSHNTNSERKLKVGDYYGIYHKKPINGNVLFYGSSSKLYHSGGCFSISDATTLDVTDVTGSSSFIVLVAVPGYVKKITARLDAPGSGSYLYIMNVDNDNKLKQLYGELEFIGTDNQTIVKEFDLNNPYELLRVDDDNKLVVYFVDKLTSTADEVELSIDYVYKSFTIYG